jgi:hypothetical protein
MSEQELTIADLSEMQELRDVNVRATFGGYVVAGQRRWLDAHGIPKAQQQIEAVATDEHEAVTLVSNFLTSGTFVHPTLEMEKLFTQRKSAE